MRGDDAGAHIAVAVRRPEGVRFEVDHLSHMGKCDLYYHISQSVNITKERDITGVAITNLA